MQIPRNPFRAALAARRRQIGLWVGFADDGVAEALAATGYDWLLIDGEHAPNDPRSTLQQLRAVAAYPTHAVVRPVSDDPALIKQYLDIGAQTLLVPMIDSAGQAARLVAATRYPPDGVRGIGAGLARASAYNQVPDYLERANDEVCLLVQAETATAMANLAEIAAVPGVDGVFFGPADLSASMGLRGQPQHPAVKQAILDGIATVRAAGKAAGTLMVDPALARVYLDAGATFVAVGIDVGLLVRAARALAAEFGGTPATQCGPALPSS